MLDKVLKKDVKLTFRRLLFVLVVIGVLSATTISLNASGLPFYGKYVGDAKASKAINQMQALIQYAQSYIRAHPHNWAAPGMRLGKDANGTAITGDGDWVENIVARNDKYFDYDYVARSRQIRAWGKAAPFDSNDRLTATLNNSGGVTWSASGQMTRVKP